MQPVIGGAPRGLEALPTLPPMTGALLAAAGGIVGALAFPPFGPGWLILPGIALYLGSLRTAPSRRRGLVQGALFGLGYFTGLLWWISELGLIAAVPLIVVQAAYPALYGWWLAGWNRLRPGRWALFAVGGWALMELVRYYFPFNGFEWGGAGYALSDQLWTRLPAATVGTSGLTVIVVSLAAMAAVAAVERTARGLVPLMGVTAAVIVVSALLWPDGGLGEVRPAVAVVQGSTPCPYRRCPPDERLRTFQQHLELTRTIEPGSVSLVVWSEGSTGSFNADPVQNPEIGAAIAAEARRIGAWILVGSDRPISETRWINANVVFSPEGEIVGEYRKQHPVPFGEYIPFRPLFEWIPDLDQVPRDMIPGDGPVVFDTGDLDLGSVISFEGSFSRYALQHRQAGADLIVVATNEGSYGYTPASDQLIGMTRMRAVELGVPVVHAAVTGKSTVIDPNGDFDRVTGLGTMEVLYDSLGSSTPTVFSATGDLLHRVAALGGVVAWGLARRRRW